MICLIIVGFSNWVFNCFSTQCFSNHLNVRRSKSKLSINHFSFPPFDIENKIIELCFMCCSTSSKMAIRPSTSEKKSISLYIVYDIVRKLSWSRREARSKTRAQYTSDRQTTFDIHLTVRRHQNKLQFHSFQAPFTFLVLIFTRFYGSHRKLISSCLQRDYRFWVLIHTRWHLLLNVSFSSRVISIANFQIIKLRLGSRESEWSYRHP